MTIEDDRHNAACAGRQEAGAVQEASELIGRIMGKREQHFQEVARYKAKFKGLSTEMIRYRLEEFRSALVKEAAIALRELLKEREQQDHDQSKIST